MTNQTAASDRTPEEEAARALANDDQELVRELRRDDRRQFVTQGVEILGEVLPCNLVGRAAERLTALAQENAALKQRVKELEGVARFGALMFDHLFEAFCDGQFEVEIGDLIARDALSCGLVNKVPFDPEVHEGEYSECCEPGDDWFVISDAGRAARRLARPTPHPTDAEGGAQP